MFEVVDVFREKVLMVLVPGSLEWMRTWKLLSLVLG